MIYVDEFNECFVDEEVICIDRSKFEVDPKNGSYLYTTDACMGRHSIPRSKMYQTRQEDRVRGLECWNRADREDSRTNNKLAHFISIGYRMTTEESVEEFILRCEEFVQRI